MTLSTLVLLPLRCWLVIRVVHFLIVLTLLVLISGEKIRWGTLVSTQFAFHRRELVKELDFDEESWATRLNWHLCGKKFLFEKASDFLRGPYTILLRSARNGVRI